jgi:asparagine synthase (glutamine-hydrolysing)
VCGIAGIFGISNTQLLKDMLTIQKHRGPDCFGTYTNGNLTLGHNRLKIRGPNNGLQPMNLNNKALVYNGEIYNMRELEKLLDNGEYKCDSEMLFDLLDKFGIEIIKKIKGEFAFAFFEKDTLYLARDCLGVKPMHYYKYEDTIYFASEIKAVSLCMQETPLLENLDIHNYVKPYGNYTPIKQIKQVLPGSVLEIKINNNKLREKIIIYNYFAGEKKICSPKKAKEKIRNTLKKTVSQMLVADVDVGLLLSGGVDSTILASIINDIGKSVPTFSVGSPTYNEFCDAEIVAREFGFKLKTIELKEDFIIKHCQNVIGKMETFDAGQFSTAIAMEKLFSKVSTRVVLSGEGPDELFGGYKEAFTILNQMVPDYDLFEIEILTSTRNMYQRQLARLDKLSLSHSIEARVPFLHKDFVTLALSIDSRLKYRKDREKTILFDSFKSKFPKQLLNKHKERFGVSAGVQQVLTENIEDLQQFVENEFQRTYCKQTISLQSPQNS